MQFQVVMGIPEMQTLYDHLRNGAIANTLNPEERELAKKFFKAIEHIEANPFHVGLASHEIGDLSARYGQRVFQSYLENRTPAARRIFWVYGPGRGQITVIALEPHPEDEKRGAYARVKLSSLPAEKQRGAVSEAGERSRARSAPKKKR